MEGRVRTPEQLIVYTPDYFRKERNIAVRTGARVVAVSHPRREVKLDSGERLRYDRLVLATGSRCDTCAIAGADQSHVFTLHTLDDAERMRAMEACGKDIAAALGRAFQKFGQKHDEKWGFALMLFSFEGPEFTWISNANRADMVKTMQEFIRRNPPDQTSEERN